MSGRAIDQTQYEGQVRNGVTLLRFLFRNHHSKPVWRAKCACGNEWDVLLPSILNGNTTACGCTRSEKNAKRFRSHGLSQTRTYRIWKKMRARCKNPNDQDYHHYGGRGIKVDPKWNSFPQFLKDMGESPPGLEIERINNNGNYEPGNCKWATRIEEMNNTRVNVLVDWNGERLTFAQFCRVNSVRYMVAWRRHFQRGWSLEDTVSRPVRQMHRRAA